MDKRFNDLCRTVEKYTALLYVDNENKLDDKLEYYIQSLKDLRDFYKRLYDLGYSVDEETSQMRRRKLHLEKACSVAENEYFEASSSNSCLIDERRKMEGKVKKFRRSSYNGKKVKLTKISSLKAAYALRNLGRIRDITWVRGQSVRSSADVSCFRDVAKTLKLPVEDRDLIAFHRGIRRWKDDCITRDRIMQNDVAVEANQVAQDAKMSKNVIMKTGQEMPASITRAEGDTARGVLQQRKLQQQPQSKRRHNHGPEFKNGDKGS